MHARQASALQRLRPLPRITAPVPMVDPPYDWAIESDDPVSASFTPLEWSMIYTALHHESLPTSQHPALVQYIELAERVRNVVRARAVAH